MGPCFENLILDYHYSTERWAVGEDVLGEDKDLTVILNELGKQGFHMAASYGTRLFLVRAVVPQEPTPEPKSPYLGKEKAEWECSESNSGFIRIRWSEPNSEGCHIYRTSAYPIAERERAEAEAKRLNDEGVPPNG